MCIMGVLNQHTELWGHHYASGNFSGSTLFLFAQDQVHCLDTCGWPGPLKWGFPIMDDSKREKPDEMYIYIYTHDLQKHLI